MLLWKRLVLSLRDSKYLSILKIQNAFKFFKRSLKYNAEPWQGGIKPLDQSCVMLYSRIFLVLVGKPHCVLCPMGTPCNGLKVVPISHNLNLDCDRRLSSFSQNWSYYSIMASMAQWQSVVISVIICKHLTSILQFEGIVPCCQVSTYLNIHPGKLITCQHSQIQKQSNLKSSPWGKRPLE